MEINELYSKYFPRQSPESEVFAYELKTQIFDRLDPHKKSILIENHLKEFGTTDTNREFQNDLFKSFGVTQNEINMIRRMVNIL